MFLISLAAIQGGYTDSLLRLFDQVGGGLTDSDKTIFRTDLTILSSIINTDFKPVSEAEFTKFSRQALNFCEQKYRIYTSTEYTLAEKQLKINEWNISHPDLPSDSIIELYDLYYSLLIARNIALGEKNDYDGNLFEAAVKYNLMNQVETVLYFEEAMEREYPTFNLTTTSVMPGIDKITTDGGAVMVSFDNNACPDLVALLSKSSAAARPEFTYSHGKHPTVHLGPGIPMSNVLEKHPTAIFMINGAYYHFDLDMYDPRTVIEHGIIVGDNIYPAKYLRNTFGSIEPLQKQIRVNDAIKMAKYYNEPAAVIEALEIQRAAIRNKYPAKMGYLIQYNPTDKNYHEPFVIKSENELTSDDIRNFSNTDKSSTMTYMLSNSPALVIDGVKTSIFATGAQIKLRNGNIPIPGNINHMFEKCKRSAIAQTYPDEFGNPGKIFFVTTEKMDFFELQNVLIQIPNVKIAFNLDGGGSTGMYLDGEWLQAPDDPDRPVGNTIIIFNNHCRNKDCDICTM